MTRMNIDIPEITEIRGKVPDRVTSMVQHFITPETTSRIIETLYNITF